MKSNEKRAAKEAAQITKLEKVSSAKPYKGYLMVLFILLAAVHVLDNYTSEIVGSVQSHIINDFFIRGMGMDMSSALSANTLITTALSMITIFAAFYKGLADKFGRKVFFIISCFGMGFGMLVIFMAQDLATYVIGRTIISFFVATDIQVLYITEIAPADKRGLYFSIASFIASLGNLLIPAMRAAFIGDDGSGWRNCFFLPGLIGVCLAVLIFFFAKESPVWVEKRLALLKTPFEERENDKKKNENKTGIFEALKEIFRDKQLRSLFLSYTAMVSATMFMISYTEPILQAAGFTEAQITAFYVSYPLMGAVINLINGPISDRIGRKKACVLFGVLTILGFLAYFLGAGAGLNAYLVGALYGLSITSYWAVLNIMIMMISESAPTRIRASAAGSTSLVGLVGSILISILLGILLGTGMDLGWTCFGGGTILTVIGLLITVFFAKETAGKELE